MAKILPGSKIKRVTPKQIFMTALHRGKTPRPATGSATSVVTTDLMEKSRIFFPEAHLSPELMAELAALGHEKLGFDNIMPLFSVCHESAALGCQVDWGDRYSMPSCRGKIANIEDDIKVREDFLQQPECQIPLKALNLLRKRYGNQVAIVGKVFGPWTLGYHIFGVQEFLIATLLNPAAVHQAINRLKLVTIRFAQAQIEAGADALCLADHATKDLCCPHAYQEFLQPVHQEFQEKLSCPLILHICGDTADRIPAISQTKIACFHFDSAVPADQARRLAGEKLALMGGTSNLNVIRKGSPEKIWDDVKEKLAAGIDIIGPECAVPLDSPSENLQFLASSVRLLRREKPG
ncbi:MAG: MtaA/CmuA family methyltransferase [Candidatus Omnitrophica bacterium]|nr:MtaA/CmuA family methyltransferase [Candidatus Omnitrophota bacterium]